MTFFAGQGMAGATGRRARPGVRPVAALLAAALLVAAAGGAAAAFADYELSIYGAVERGSPAAEGLTRFIQLVEDRTGDRVELALYPFHLPAEEAVTDLHAGALDLVLAPLSAFAAYVPTVHTWALPYLFDDSRHVEEVIYGPVGRGFLQGLERAGLWGVALWDGGFRHMGTLDQPVRGLEDVAGLKVAVQDPPDVKAWEGFGAEPLVVPWSRVRAQLTSGGIAGVVATPYEARAAGLLGSVGHMSLIGYRWTGYLLAANPWVWKDLPVGIRQTLQEAAVEAGRWVARRWARVHEDALASLQKEGVHVEEAPDTAGFRQRAEELLAVLRDEPWFDGRLADSIRAVRRDRSHR